LICVHESSVINVHTGNPKLNLPVTAQNFSLHTRGGSSVIGSEAMWKCLLLALASGAVDAAVIRGTVVENQSGHPLARTLVALQPVAGTAGQPQSVRTNLYGTFQFAPVPAGSYLVSASRAGFASVQYGQKQWKSSGIPIQVGENDSPHLSMRLQRFGAITGTVLDENDVGLPEYEVVVYRNKRPPQLVTRAKSDDRGVFHLYGLEPGSYLVRASSKEFEEGGYLPTFSKESQIVEQAYAVEVELDQQVDRIEVRPNPGRLFTFTVEVVPYPLNAVPQPPVTLTLVSDVGRETVQAATHRFGPLPAGQYELFTQAPLHGRVGIQGDYRRVTISRDTSVSFDLHEVPEMPFSFAGAPSDLSSPQVLGRRRDLAGETVPELVKLTKNRVQLAPGPWEVALVPPAGLYVSGFSGPGYQPPSDRRADGWNEFLSGWGGPGVRFTLSSSPGAVHGQVKSGGDPVAGAPVFLEPFDLEPRRRVTDTIVTRTEKDGQYRFSGLAPGNYRVLSSFEYRMPDSPTMENAGAKLVKVEEGRDVQQDLDLFVIR
jgi:hypothetical protein